MLHHLDHATIQVANLVNYNCHPLKGAEDHKATHLRFAGPFNDLPQQKSYAPILKAPGVII